MKVKFRAFDKENLKIYPVKRLQWDDRGNIKHTRDCILMQFTGLEDRNEKEIYDGDILIESFGDGDYVIFNIIWADLYDAGYNEITAGNPRCIYDIRLNRSSSRQTIIGNIYENPKMKRKSYWTKKKIRDVLVATGEGEGK